MKAIADLASTMMLGMLLEQLQQAFGGYELVAHWRQGEFHHDVVLRVNQRGGLPGPVLVVATNCNGGVKEVLCFSDVPERSALWHERCPSAHEFSGNPPALLASARTTHWFDPCELLLPDARSEYREEFRRRQPGGGWEPSKN